MTNTTAASKLSFGGGVLGASLVSSKALKVTKAKGLQARLSLSDW